jgi:acyl-coenzyme A thioesterase PaaI-like protein
MQRLRSFVVRHLMSLYPPYLGAGVRVRMAPDLTSCRVTMKLRWWNRNYLGTHFGGSLYSMCDPFFVLLLAERLGRGYEVWDKAATIRFRRPGRGTVHAEFRLSDEELAAVRAAVAREGRHEPTFRATVVDDQGRLVAEVDKVLSVRARASVPAAGEAPGAGR